MHTRGVTLELVRVAPYELTPLQRAGYRLFEKRQAMQRAQRYRALALWRAEIASGRRTATAVDALAKAARLEAEAEELERTAWRAFDVARRTPDAVERHRLRALCSANLRGVAELRAKADATIVAAAAQRANAAERQRRGA